MQTGYVFDDIRVRHIKGAAKENPTNDHTETMMIYEANGNRNLRNRTGRKSNHTF